MTGTQQYHVFFVNQGSVGGLACLYQDPANAPCNDAGMQSLAWMVCGAEAGVQIDFQWQVAYDFAWFDDIPPATQEIMNAGVGAVFFSLDQYGYRFQADTPPPTGQLSIQAAASISSTNDVLVGLGMSGTGTFACPARPNTHYLFTPVPDSDLLYWVAFGANFALNAPIDLATLPYMPVQLAFPAGVYAMTVTLQSDNVLVLTTGAPKNDASLAHGQSHQKIVYRNGHMC